MPLLIEALLIGLAIAAPVGPIGLLCINRTLHHGPAMGLATGLGAATADAIYASIGAGGISVLIVALTALAKPLAILGSVTLLYMGITSLHRSSVEQKASGQECCTIWSAYSSALALTSTNPMTILSFMAIFAGLMNTQQPSHLQALIMVIGVFCGSALWWVTLAYGISGWLIRLGGRTHQWVDRISGLLFIAFAVSIFWPIAH